MAKRLPKLFILVFTAATTTILTPRYARAQDYDPVRVTQKAPQLRNYDQLSLGIGLGLDYGGLGGSLMYYPVRNLGVFGGLGYALIGLGYNAGIKLRFLSKRPDPRATPYLTGMYGYNMAVKVKDAGQYNKFFYGPTFGIGLDTRYKPQRAGYWSFALLVPIRAGVDKYMDDLTNNYGIHFDSRPPDAAISIGFHFVFHKQESRKTF